MADIAIFRINFKSDFILTLQSDAGWLTPFCIKFWTGAPSQAYFVCYDGTTYTHCAPVDGDPTRLTVQFDDHNLPIGNLKFQIAYHFTVADFPNDTEDEVINPASIIIEIDGTPHQVMLDFQGETAPEIEFSLPAYANEAQRIANEEERERIFAEMQAENAEAVEGAERVNATLNGNILTVYNRNGIGSSVNTKGEPGIGIPAGGTTNQVLVKESDSDYDVKWRNAPASGVSSVNGKYGDVVLNAGDVGAQPTIADLQEIRSGAAAGATAYQKPSTGIPKNDLASGVQASLNKADTALQSYTESDPVFTASPAHGITSADITAWNGKADKVAIVNHGTSDTTFTLTPNIFHLWGTVTSLTLTLATASTTTMDEFMFQFTSGTTATTLSLPSTVKWVAEPEIEAGMTYQVSIVNNIAVIGGVA